MARRAKAIDRSRMTVWGNNILVVQADHLQDLIKFATDEALEQFSIVRDGDIWQISTPMNLSQQHKYSFLF